MDTALFQNFEQTLWQKNMAEKYNKDLPMQLFALLVKQLPADIAVTTSKKKGEHTEWNTLSVSDTNETKRVSQLLVCMLKDYPNTQYDSKFEPQCYKNSKKELCSYTCTGVPRP